MLKFFPDCCKNQIMCSKAVGALLPALKFNSNYSVANKMLEKLDCVFSNDGIFFVDVYSDAVTFFNDDMDHNTINLNNINFDDNSFDEVDSEISNKLLPAIWHPTRWLDW